MRGLGQYVNLSMCIYGGWYTVDVVRGICVSVCEHTSSVICVVVGWLIMFLSVGNVMEISKGHLLTRFGRRHFIYFCKVSCGL